MHLKQLTKIITAHYQWTPKVYPFLAQHMSEETRKCFERSHSIFHLMKQVGMLATAQERADHGDHTAFPKETMIPILGKLLINTLMMATVLEISINDIEHWILEFYKTKLEQP